MQAEPCLSSFQNYQCLATIMPRVLSIQYMSYELDPSVFNKLYMLLVWNEVTKRPHLSSGVKYSIALLRVEIGGLRNIVIFHGKENGEHEGIGIMKGSRSHPCPFVFKSTQLKSLFFFGGRGCMAVEQLNKGKRLSPVGAYLHLPSASVSPPLSHAWASHTHPA